ncbi:MAG: hypothetical protein EP310_03820 [Bacteroidetes bacterium]|nr:MAG: hypothetical protein EP310_03820 [Bacteroidota bacterium]
MSKLEIKEKENQLLEMVGTFCSQHLDEDYFQLCEKLVKKMGRKREVPFQRGQLEIWAAAVVYAIGSINFLFDKSFEPYMSTEQICDYFGQKVSTVSSKAKTIKDMFKLRYYDPEFATKKMADSNPFNDFVMVDGFIQSIYSLPEELQKMVKDARSKGGDIQFHTKQP